jgi:hypothetical protein
LDFLLHGSYIQAGLRVEDLNVDLACRRAPVPDNFAILENHRPEGALLVVGMVAMARMQDHLATLVSDEVFIIGGQEVDRAAAETAGK